MAQTKVLTEGARKLRRAQHDIRDVAQSLIRLGYGIEADGLVHKLYYVQATLLACAAALDPNPYLQGEETEDDSLWE